MPVIRNRWAVVVAACLLGAPVHAAQRADRRRATTEPQQVSVRALIGRALGDKHLGKAVAAVHVVMVPTGQVIYSTRADRPAIPASNMKLLVTAASLALFGPDFVFRTRLYLVGRDLVVVGGGDPTIDRRFADGHPEQFLRQWACELKRAGLTRVDGDLVVDDGLFDQDYVHPSWPRDQLDKWYCAPVGALSLSENCVSVHVQPTDDRSAVVAELVPPVDYIDVVPRHLEVADRAKDHRWGIVRHPTRDQVTVSGSVFQAHDGLVTVRCPPRYFGAVFRRALEDQGIAVAGRVRHQVGVPLTGAKLLHTHQSPLLTALTVCNKDSRGFYAEMLLKMLGTRMGKGTWAHGRAVLDAFAKQRGLAAKGYLVDDGSGLSRKNRLTARQLAGLLLWMAKQPYGDRFRKTLAVGGIDGTLDSRFTDPAVRGRVFAKTGYIAGVRALSGYVLTRRNRWLAASFLFNRTGSHAKHVIDRICTTLIENL